VLQNEHGQQFPVSYETMRQFVVRWPTRLEIIEADAFLEITGQDIGSNQVRTNHIDVYEGSARALVSPIMLRMFGANRVITPLDIEQMQLYGAIFPFSPYESMIPPRVHVVGNILGLEPLRVGVAGNNWVIVDPAIEGIEMTQVTNGTPDAVEKGDLVYFVPENVGQKSLGVSRFILYKKVPFRVWAK
jgi:hypothetical protein